MSELKTQPTTASVQDFIATVESEQKRNDATELVKIFEATTGHPAVMWGKSIIGFGSYHYKSSRSKQEGNWMLTAFAPRKAAISLYIHTNLDDHADLLEKLGPHKRSSGCCVYIKKLSDIHIPTLKKLIKTSVKDAKNMFNN